MPEETPQMHSMQEHDPVADAAQEAVGVGAVQADDVLKPEETVKPAPAAAPPNTHDAMPAPKSSLTILLPILLILAAFAVWAFMPMALDPNLAKLGKVTDKGAYYEIEYPGDGYAAVEEIGKLMPELIAEMAKPEENGKPVTPYSDGKTHLDVVGDQNTKPALIRVMKQANYTKLR